jgi:hypothetical protein
LAANSAGKFPADSKIRNPQETITYKGFSWELESAGNVFPADFLPKSAGKSAGKQYISSSVENRDDSMDLPCKISTMSISILKCF